MTNGQIQRFYRLLGIMPSGATRHDAANQRRVHWPGWRPLFCVLAVLLLLYAATALQRGLQAVSVGSVQFSGHSGALDGRVGASEVALQALFSERLSGGFWHLDLSAMRRDLERHPWVNQATIRRQWPNQLWVGIDEHVAIARWNDRHLLSASGQLFAAESLEKFQHLPLFRTEQLADELQIRAHAVLYNRLQQPLLDRQLEIRTLEKKRNGDIRLVLHNGVQIDLGRRDIERRLARFLALFDSVLASKIDLAECIDLRYPDGFSVRWRMPSESLQLAVIESAELRSRRIDRADWSQ